MEWELGGGWGGGGCQYKNKEVPIFLHGFAIALCVLVITFFSLCVIEHFQYLIFSVWALLFLFFGRCCLCISHYYNFTSIYLLSQLMNDRSQSPLANFEILLDGAKNCLYYMLLKSIG